MRIPDILDLKIKPEDTVQDIRTRLLHAILFLISALGLPALIIAAVEAYLLQQHTTIFVYALFFVPIVFVTIFRKQLSYRLSVYIVICFTLLLAIGNVITYGFSGAGIPILFTLFAITTLFLNQKAGLLIILISAISVSIIGYLYISHNISLDISLNEISTNLISWITALSVLVLLGSVIVFSYSIVHSKMLQSIELARQKANELRINQEQLEDMVEKRTASLEEKANKLQDSQQAMVYLVEDVNEARDELNKLNVQIIASNKELEAFSYSVSHDLRAPLRAIDGFSKFLFEDYADKLDEEGHRLLRVIRENANKMDRLIADMLNLSRLTRLEMNYSSINMKSMAESIYHETASDEQKNEFEIVIHKMPNVNADSSLIKQVWINLIGNALKYSKHSEKKIIEIGGEESDGKIVYWIKDYGAGFNEKYVAKMFGVFQRLHSEKEFKGTGVGLAIVQRIVHRHSGEVWAKGEINKGATVYFSLPK